MIADNCGTHKHPRVKVWLARRPATTSNTLPPPTRVGSTRWSAGSVSSPSRPFGAEWFRSLGELVQKIDVYVATYNLHWRPFVRTATADSILATLQRLCKVINGICH